MIHRGEIVRLRLKGMGFKLSQIADRSGIARSSIYKYLNEQDLSWSIIQQIGSAIRYNFRKDFPDMPVEVLEIQEALMPFDHESDPAESMSKSELRLVAETWKNKYLELMEEHVKLLRQIRK
jgi:transcriptional regulator with XRE-family HTH domain